MLAKLVPRFQFDVSFADLCKACTFLFNSKPFDSQSIVGLWKTKRAAFCSLSVRSAWDLALTQWNFDSESEIIVSPITVKGMIEIIYDHGLVPVPVDLQLNFLVPSLEELERALTPKTKAILISYLYGSKPRIDAILDFAKKHNLLLIEDAAQAFDGLDYAGNPEADLSMFSFGPIKTCTALGGAVSFCKSNLFARAVEEREKSWVQLDNLWFLKRVFKYGLLKFLSCKRVYGFFMSMLTLFTRNPDQVLKSLVRGFGSGSVLQGIRKRAPLVLMNFLKYRLQNYSQERLSRRRHLGRTLVQNLPSVLSIPGSKVEDHSFWIFPVIVKDADRWIRILRDHGFDANGSGTNVGMVDGSRFAMPVAKLLSSSLLYLPLSPDLSDKDFKALLTFLKRT